MQFRSRTRAGFNDTLNVDCDFFRRCAPENPLSMPPRLSIETLKAEEKEEAPCACGDLFWVWIAIGILYFQALTKGK